MASLSVRLPLVTGLTSAPSSRILNTFRAWRLMSSLAHIDDALLPKHGADGRGGDAVLSGAGLGDDPALSHSLRQETLAERVVDLVSARVREVLALDVNMRAAQLAGQVFGVVQLRRPADVVARQKLEPGLELLVRSGGLVLDLDLVNRAHQRLGHVHASELPEASLSRPVEPVSVAFSLPEVGVDRVYYKTITRQTAIHFRNEDTMSIDGQDDQEQSKKPEPGRWIGIGMAMGVAIGTAIGVALDNIGLGIAIGAGVGVALGAGLRGCLIRHFTPGVPACVAST